MANSLYTKGKQGLLDGSIVWLTGNIKAMLVDTSVYTVNATTDQYLSDIPSGARIASSGLLANRTATDGVADADDVTLNSVFTTGDVDGIVLYNDTGTTATSRLLMYIDTVTSGFPITAPEGGSVTVTWPSDANKIFKL